MQKIFISLKRVLATMFIGKQQVFIRLESGITAVMNISLTTQQKKSTKFEAESTFVMVC